MNPKMVSLSSQTYTTSFNGTWKTVGQVPSLQAAASLFYYVTRSGGASPNVLSCSELNRLMNSGEVDGMTSVFSNTYPNLPDCGAQNTWNQLANFPELKQVMQVLSSRSSGDCASTSIVEVDQSVMVFDDGDEKQNSGAPTEDELESFFTATVGTSESANNSDDEEDNEESYDSDGGTTYVKDPISGEFVSERDLPPEVKAMRRKKKDKVEGKGGKSSKPDSQNQPSAASEENKAKKAAAKKRKADKFNNSAKGSKKWIYVTGLPSDVTEVEIAQHFSKAGVLDISPETQQPKIKLYKTEDGLMAKGDCSLCFAREESVDLAMDILDGSILRADGTGVMKITKAAFTQKGESFVQKKSRLSVAQRKVAKLASQQATSWDEGDNGRISGGLKGLTIIVLKNVFNLEELSGVEDEDSVLKVKEAEILKECESVNVEVLKLTIFSKNKDGVVIAKFKQVESANSAVKHFQGLKLGDREISCHFWDGVTDYTVKLDADEEAKIEEARLDEFGDWLEGQEDELPEELRVK